MYILTGKGQQLLDRYDGWVDWPMSEDGGAEFFVLSSIQVIMRMILDLSQDLVHQDMNPFRICSDLDMLRR